MAHNAACRKATSPTCKCSGCGGSEHGWGGHLDRAAGPADERDAWREAADRRWFTTLQERREKGLTKPTHPVKRAAADRAVADIVEWLAADGTRRTRVQEIGDHIAREALTKLENHARKHADTYADSHDPDDGDLRELRKTIPGHFWCSLLADLSGAADSADSTLDSVPERAADALGAEAPPGWNPKGVQRYVAGYTLKLLWEFMKPLVFQWDLKTLIRVLRVLAVLICPDPGTHERVARLCLVPLASDVLTDAAESRLHQALGEVLDLS